MLKNYLLTAYRNFRRNYIFTTINVVGLAVGMAVCIMIAQFVTFEKSYDQFHANYDNIYRIINVRHFPTHIDESAGCVTALGPTLKDLYPEVQSFTRFYESERVLAVPGEQPLRFTNVFSVDSTFFDVFSFHPEGEKLSLLSKPNTAVLTKSAARRLFGESPAEEQTVLLNGDTPYLVEAVVEDTPPNSHIQFDVLLSLVSDFNDPHYCWSCNNRNTYILLDAKADPAKFEHNAQKVVQKLHEGDPIKREYKLQALSKIHLNSNVRFEHGDNGSAKSVVAFAIIAGLILFIAGLNYINLTTSLAISRSNEVGIRKVNGSTRRNLVTQFLLESFLVNAIAFLCALCLAQLLFPFFSLQIGTYPELTILSEPFFWVVIVSGLITGSVVYGFYPAFVISSFKPLTVLRGKSQHSSSKGSTSMRTTLVFVQFTFSIALLACTFAVYKQLNFMKTLDLGMDINQTLVIPVPSDYSQKEDPFAHDLLGQSSVTALTHTSELVGSEIRSVGSGYRTETMSIENGQQMSSLYMAQNYFTFFSIDFLAGRNFISEQQHNDRNTEIIINDAARKVLAFNSPEEAIGNVVVNNHETKGTIVGVVRDHHLQSADQPITPLIFQYTTGKSFYLAKSPTASFPQIIAAAEKSFRKHFPNKPFEYFFLDDHFNAQYKGLEKFGRTFSTFTSLAVIIACIGLSGLTLYTVKVRAKEIALRKVLGASVPHLLLTLSRDYTKLLVLAFGVAVPAAAYGIKLWLQGFAYHVELSWHMLAIPGCVVIVIAWLTIAAQSLKTIARNPTESLKGD